MAPIMSSPLFSKYLTEIGSIPLLTPEREAELGRIVQFGVRTDATETQKIASEEAQQELIRSNLKLVVSIANRFLGSAVTLEEMTSDGNQGLTESAKRYNPVFKTRFSTYATWWIQQAIRQGLQRSHTVRTPVRRARLLRKILNCRSFIEDARDQDLHGIEKETGIPKAQITRILSSGFTFFSLSAPQHDGDEVLEAVIDSGCEDPAEATMREEDLQLLSGALSELSSLEKRIVSARFGINAEGPETLDSLAAGYGVSRERIRQIEKTALRRMRMKIKRLDDGSNGEHQHPAPAQSDRNLRRLPECIPNRFVSMSADR